MWDEESGSEEESDSEEDESSSEEDEEPSVPAAGGSSAAPTGNLNERLASTSLGNDAPTTVSRSDRKAAKKKEKPTDGSDDDDDDLVNPNRAAPKPGKASDIGKAPQPMSRRERCVLKVRWTRIPRLSSTCSNRREALEKKQAQERYMKLHRTSSLRAVTRHSSDAPHHSGRKGESGQPNCSDDC